MVPPTGNNTKGCRRHLGCPLLSKGRGDTEDYARRGRSSASFVCARPSKSLNTQGQLALACLRFTPHGRISHQRPVLSGLYVDRSRRKHQFSSWIVVNRPTFRMFTPVRYLSPSLESSGNMTLCPSPKFTEVHRRRGQEWVRPGDRRAL